uniref:Uncharacterized protein n=1 Tax=Rhizophora mucronata TaxID=61149 RepID=A0A2P2IIF4_RHIMU
MKRLNSNAKRDVRTFEAALTFFKRDLVVKVKIYQNPNLSLCIIKEKEEANKTKQNREA